MLVDAFQKVVRYANVQRSGRVSHDIDIVWSHVALSGSALDFSAPLEMTYGVALSAEGAVPVQRAVFQDKEGLFIR